jgi:hypothetical protein
MPKRRGNQGGKVGAQCDVHADEKGGVWPWHVLKLGALVADTDPGAAEPSDAHARRRGVRTGERNTTCGPA